METGKGSKRQAFLSFKLGGEIFATSVHKVLEVLERQKIMKIPKTPEYFKGVINFRGEILPVIDTRLKFNMSASEETSKTVIIVLDMKIKDRKVNVGAIADSVKDVLEIREDEIMQVPEIVDKSFTEFLLGIWKSDNNFIMILDIEKLFSKEDLQLAKEAGNLVDMTELED